MMIFVSFIKFNFKNTKKKTIPFICKLLQSTKLYTERFPGHKNNSFLISFDRKTLYSKFTLSEM